MEPVNSRRTSGARLLSRRVRSTVTIGRPALASRVTRPCPISPPAPVTSVTGVRIYADHSKADLKVRLYVLGALGSQSLSPSRSPPRPPRIDPSPTRLPPADGAAL